MDAPSKKIYFLSGQKINFCAPAPLDRRQRGPPPLIKRRARGAVAPSAEASVASHRFFDRRVVSQTRPNVPCRGDGTALCRRRFTAGPFFSCWPGEARPGRQRMACVPRLVVLIYAPCPYLSIISARQKRHYASPPLHDLKAPAAINTAKGGQGEICVRAGRWTQRHRGTHVCAAPGFAPMCDGLSAKAIRGNDGSSGKCLGGPCCSSTNRRRALSGERVRGSLGGTLDVATAVLRRCEGARGAVATLTETPRPRHHARCSIRTGPLPPPHATPCAGPEKRGQVGNA